MCIRLVFLKVSWLKKLDIRSLMLLAGGLGDVRVNNVQRKKGIQPKAKHASYFLFISHVALSFLFFLVFFFFSHFRVA